MCKQLLSKMIKATCLMLLLFQCFSAAGGENSRTWNPAHYEGLTVGTSTRDDVVQCLGKGKAGKEQDTGLPTLTYTVSVPIPGTLTVYIKNDVLVGITLTLQQPLTKTGVIRIFGDGYLSVQYDTDDCLTEGGSAPIYESPGGPIKHLEYRNLGVGVIMHDDRAVAITYGSKPYGRTYSRCSPKGRTQR